MTGFAIAAVSALTLAGAWIFELVLRLEPCPLCLEQRIPYYMAVPIGLLVGWLALAPARHRIVRFGLVALAGVLIAGAGYGVYHAGIEWGWWQGPAACAGGGALATPPADILGSLKATQRVVSCSDAAWRFLGISLAGYNTIIATALAALALRAAFTRV